MFSSLLEVRRLIGLGPEQQTPPPPVVVEYCSHCGGVGHGAGGDRVVSFACGVVMLQ